MKTREDAREPITVCIVDDEPAVLDSTAQLIARAQGFRVAGCYISGEEALERIPAVQPDIVLIDQRLPLMPGSECATRLKARLPRLKVLFMTAYADEALVRVSIQGGTSLLTKPFGRQRLFDALKVVADGDIYLSHELEHLLSNLTHGGKHEPAPGVLKKLSNREREVLRLSAAGMSYKEIAAELHIRYKWVDHILERVRSKLHVQRTIDAVRKLARNNPYGNQQHSEEEGQGPSNCP